MSERNRYSLIKISPERVKEAIANATLALPGSPPRESAWSDWTYRMGSKRVLALACHDTLILADDAWPLAREIATLVQAPHLELRVQEGDHWDFTLSKDGSVIADFSTRVAYFESDSSQLRPWKQGDAQTFAAEWGVPLDRVAPYLIDWSSVQGASFVVEHDEFPTGDWRQVFDFLRALGASSPEANQNSFAVDVPSWEGGYITQPLWRRVVRRISVWIKGTYPDVPRQTPEQRALWRQRRESVRVIRINRDGSQTDILD